MQYLILTLNGIHAELTYVDILHINSCIESNMQLNPYCIFIDESNHAFLSLRRITDLEINVLVTQSRTNTGSILIRSIFPQGNNSETRY